MAFNLFKKKDTKKDTKEEKPTKAIVDVPAADVQGKTEEKKTVVAAAPITGISVLKYFHVSEKSSLGHKINQFTFVVTPHATKSEIAKEVENRYKVSVEAVNVNKRRGKHRRIGVHTGKTVGFKKAIVTLADGQSIPDA